MQKEIDEETRRAQAQQDEIKALSKTADVQRNSKKCGFLLNPFSASLTKANLLPTAAAPPQTSGVRITDLGPDETLKHQVSEADIKLNDVWMRDFNPNPKKKKVKRNQVINWQELTLTYV